MDDHLDKIRRDLGITAEHLEKNRLSLHEQPRLKDLEVVDIDFEGRPFILLSAATKAWLEMRRKAQREGIHLMPYSGFRSYLHQKRLIERHLKNGRMLESILTHIAIPGFSEHHSGRAIDIHTKGNPILENTIELNWLMENASSFEFRLSYPKSNSYGIIYEPWHWFYEGK